MCMLTRTFMLIKRKKKKREKESHDPHDGLAHIDPHPCRCDPVNYALSPSNLKS